MGTFPESWIKSELAKLLGFESDEIVEYIKAMSDGEEQRNYLMEMLDMNNANHLNFIMEFNEKVQSSSKRILAAAPAGMVAYKKSDDNQVMSNGARPKTSKQKTPPNQPTHNKENTPCVIASNSSHKKAPGKFVPLFSKDGKMDDSVILLPGRNPCECQAQKHDLVNNCIRCGRIVCKQEGSGPCLFCGNLVCTRDEQEVLNRGSKKSDQLMKKLTGADSKSKAEQHKNVLLEYDRTSEKRTKVIDDESDYFSVDSEKWMTNEQKQKLKKVEQEIWEQRHGSRLNKKYTFDFAGRQIIEDGSIVTDQYKEEAIKRILEPDSSKSNKVNAASSNNSDSTVANPNVMRPLFIDDNPGKASTQVTSDHAVVDSKHKLRLQDAELQVMRDDGWCLSMHQPWASYLVAGIKMHEGRTWYSPHRGRLWIHSASKVPTDDEIAAVQQQYIGSKKVAFPENLPVSCLLGCVDVVDVLGQEEYREKYPQGESSSPFVFICQNPQELMIKFPMTGQHKIYKLDSNIHKAAKKSAKKVPISINNYL